MSRRTYIQIPALFLGAAILSILGIVVWALALIPVMIYPPLANAFAADKMTGIVTKKMMHSAMKKSRDVPAPTR
jgi:hypothetical protein